MCLKLAHIPPFDIKCQRRCWRLRQTQDCNFATNWSQREINKWTGYVRRGISATIKVEVKDPKKKGRTAKKTFKIRLEVSQSWETGRSPAKSWLSIRQLYWDAELTALPQSKDTRSELVFVEGQPPTNHFYERQIGTRIGGKEHNRVTNPSLGKCFDPIINNMWEEELERDGGNERMLFLVKHDGRSFLVSGLFFCQYCWRYRLNWWYYEDWQAPTVFNSSCHSFWKSARLGTVSVFSTVTISTATAVEPYLK